MKRFTDTDIWDKEWFMLLPPIHKCLMKYLHDKCDNAGIWSPNWILASTCIKENVNAEDLVALGNQVEVMANGKIFIPSFIQFQYGELSDKCVPHQKVISLLKKHNLYDRIYIPYSKGSNTLQDKEEDKEEDKDTDGKGAGGKPIKALPLKKAEEQQRQTALKAGYKTLQEEWEGKADKEVFAVIKKFVEEEKPCFPDPYVDAWNIFAPWYSLETVREITDDRRDKIKIRTREPGFDFFKILATIRQQKWLTGDSKNGWKVTFNYLIDSQKKYTEIIEKYHEN